MPFGDPRWAGATGKVQRQESMLPQVMVFSAPTPFEAHFVRQLLEQRGVEAQVRNDTFSPYGTVNPEVWIDDADLPTAQDVLSHLQAKRDADGALSVPDTSDAGSVSLPESSERKCPQCKETNPRGFEVCWQCGEAIA